MRRLLVALVCAVLGVLAAATPAAAASEHVLVVGIGGLRWSDLARMPTLERLAEDAALGTVTVRTVRGRTCPLDGWLTLSAGRRAAGPERCGPLPQASGGQLPGWADLASSQGTYAYEAHLGDWAAQLEAAGVCATAVGPGAAVALADRNGRLAENVGDCPLTVVDAGTISGDRTAAAAVAEAKLSEALRGVPPDTTILVTGVSDEPTASGPVLRVAVAAGPGFGKAWLTSHSTRWKGVVQLPDVRPTVTRLLGLTPTADESSTPWESGEQRPDTATTVRELTGIDTAAQMLRTQAFALLGVIAAVIVLALLAGALHRRVLAAALGLLGAALPVSAYAAGLGRWWSAGDPSRAAWIAIAVSALVIGGIAFGLRLALPRLRFAGPAFVAAVTVVVLAVDVITGSTLQHTSLLGSGVSPLLAGRFFGFGNVAFSLFAASLLLLLAAVATLLRPRGILVATGAVLVLGLLAVAVDGWPDWGADFGGVLALVPAVLLLAGHVAGIRLTVARVLLAGLAAVVAVGAIALADWLRPPAERTHLGAFVQRILDGDLWPALVRKLDTSIGIAVAGGALSLLAIPVFVAAALVVFRPEWFRAQGLIETYAVWPALKGALQAIVVAAVIGFALNDSGLVVPACMLMTALPLVVVASVRTERPRPGAA